MSENSINRFRTRSSPLGWDKSTKVERCWLKGMLQWKIISKPKLIEITQLNRCGGPGGEGWHIIIQKDKNRLHLSPSLYLSHTCAHIHTELLNNHTCFPLYFMLRKPFLKIPILCKICLLKRILFNTVFPYSHREWGWQALWVVIVQQVSGTNWLIQKVISCLRLD